jgi:hypothetical protein
MFSKLKSDVYGVFASSAWIATGYKAYPDNYSGAIDSSSAFIRITILPGKSTVDAHGLKKKLSGMLILSIFVKAGNGDAQLFSIADSIDSFFQGKTLTNGTQFGTSTLVKLGLDPADKSLYRGDYSINFKAYGE